MNDAGGRLPPGPDFISMAGSIPSCNERAAVDDEGFPRAVWRQSETR